MMKKLTYYDKWLGKYMPHKGTALGDIYAKLGRLEEAETAGRLVILPEEFDKKRCLDLFIAEYCPNEFGLQNLETCLCSGDELRKCTYCWKAALKGGGQP